uniref:Uncharacterized protein n=1 Tax=Xiphophorus couchianus TaxID=32473 RepID=A0A3B5M617_9TELE
MIKKKNTVPKIRTLKVTLFENKAVSSFIVSQGDRLIRSASPTKGVSAKNPASTPSTPHSAPVSSKAVSTSPKTIFPYPSHQNASPKSPHRLSFSGIFRSNSTSSSIKIFSRTRRGKWISHNRNEGSACSLNDSQELPSHPCTVSPPPFSLPFGCQCAFCCQ